MIRKLITLVLPVLLPLLICWAYVAWARYKARLEGRQEPDWREARWGYALLAGAVLAAASLVFWRFYSGQELGSIINPFSILPGPFNFGP